MGAVEAPVRRELIIIDDGSTDRVHKTQLDQLWVGGRGQHHRR